MRIAYNNIIKSEQELVLPKDFNLFDAIEETRKDVHDKYKLTRIIRSLKLLFKPIELTPGLLRVLFVSYMEVNGVETNN